MCCIDQPRGSITCGIGYVRSRVYGIGSSIARAARRSRDATCGKDVSTGNISGPPLQRVPPTPENPALQRRNPPGDNREPPHRASVYTPSNRGGRGSSDKHQVVRRIKPNSSSRMCAMNEPHLNRLFVPSLSLASILGCPNLAHAQDTLNTGDTAWVLTSTALVLFMTIPALALFYGGLVRTKNVLSILMQCLILTAAMSVLWVMVGYSLAFSEGNAIVGSVGDKLFMMGIGPDAVIGSIPEILFAAFQMTFAIITPALIVGAFAERMRFSAMLLFSASWLLVVYAPICHMTWGGGLFATWGVLDFAGGIVVHITAGVAALVLCIVLGPRKGYPDAPIPPHNLTMTFMGTSMLWVGWFGFNAGSALGASGGAAMALLVTHISASVATLTWVAIDWYRDGKPSLLGAATGSIAGLAAVTPASGFIGPFGALVIGLGSTGNISGPPLQPVSPALSPTPTSAAVLHLPQHPSCALSAPDRCLAQPRHTGALKPAAPIDALRVPVVVHHPATHRCLGGPRAVHPSQRSTTKARPRP